MVDVLTKKQRSFNMSQIKARDTKPEITLRKLLFEKGIRGYRIHYKLPGKPDIVFTKRKVVIFIDGCFWHKCPSCFVTPGTQTEFWMKKINANVKRDIETTKILINDSWNVLRFWEHDVKKNSEKIISKISRSLIKKR
jgi:DNA mismatch endonuclease, patch repair protein